MMIVACNTKLCCQNRLILPLSPLPHARLFSHYPPPETMITVRTGVIPIGHLRTCERLLNLQPLRTDIPAMSLGMDGDVVGTRLLYRHTLLLGVLEFLPLQVSCSVTL